MKFPDPYVNIPGAEVQHLTSFRDPWRWVTSTGGERKGIPRVACFHGAHSRNRDDAERTDVRNKRPLCKTCIKQWEWEAFWLQRRSASLNYVIFGMV